MSLILQPSRITSYEAMALNKRVVVCNILYVMNHEHETKDCHKDIQPSSIIIVLYEAMEFVNCVSTTS